MKNINKEQITEEIIALIQKGNAHVSFEEAVADIPAVLRSKTPPGLPYNIWQLAEHIKITQWDIVEFCLSAEHKSPKWPDEYWPKPITKITDKQWELTINQIKEDRNRFIELLNNPRSDLFAIFPHGDGQNLFREALLIADHTAYHVGEILVLRRLLKDWK